MKHAPKIAALMALEERRLSPRARARIERHLARCEVCRRALASIRLYEQVAEDVREQNAPAIDWSQMELALERQVQAEARNGSSSNVVALSPAARARTSLARAAIGIALAAAAAVALVWAWPQEREEVARPEVPEADEAPVPAPAPPVEVARAPLSATVTLLAGADAQIVGPEGAHPIALGESLAEGTTMRVGQASEVHVRLAEGTGVVGRGETEIALHRLREGDVELALASGKIAAASGGPLFQAESRFVVLAAEHRFELRVTRTEIALDDEGVVELAVAEGEVAVHRPDGTMEVVRAPGRWRSAATSSGDVMVRAPHGIAGESAGASVLRVTHPRSVRWTVGDVEAEGAGQLAMRVGAGELAIAAFEASGRAFRTVVTVGGDGVSLDADDLQAEPPRVREGFLREDDIRAVLQRGLPRLRQCYEQGLRERPDLAGRLTVRITVGLDGSVSRVRVVGGDVPDGLETCVSNYAERWTFPPPVGGFVTFDAPLAFGTR